MQEIYLIRHGETDWNAQKRMQGHIRHVPLNAQGIAQAEQSVALLQNTTFDLIIASPTLRTTHTAQIISAAVGVDVLHDERLIERCLGSAEGKTLEEIALETLGCPLPDGIDARNWLYNKHLPAGAEPIDALKQRAHAAFHDVIATHTGKRVLLVTHGAWLRALTQELTGEDMFFGNAIPYKAHKTAEGWRISALG